MGARPTRRILRVITAAWVLVLFLGAAFRVLADCAAFGLPFNDLGSTTFCAEIAEAYFSGLTNGTTPTTYAPSNNVTRQQMAAFVTRTLDQSLLRGSRRTAIAQRWNSSPHYDLSLGLVPMAGNPPSVQSDGRDLWVAQSTSSSVSRVRASDGTVLDTWTGATDASQILVAMNRIFITGNANLYMIDPTQAAGPVTKVVDGALSGASGVTFDGNNIWVANFGDGVSIITPGTWAVALASGSFSEPQGILFDGANVWVASYGDDTLKKIDAGGAVLKTVSVGHNPGFPIFDGHNIWVPGNANSDLTVVRASDGTVLKTFSAGNGNQNGLSDPFTAAFDGERILVTNSSGSVSLFRATDLSIIGFFSTPGGIGPSGACSDGLNFWVTFYNSGGLGRF